MTKKMDRVAERARTGREDAEMLAGIDQAQLDAMVDAIPVSYTHLDVYKRQSSSCW